MWLGGAGDQGIFALLISLFCHFQNKASISHSNMAAPTLLIKFIFQSLGRRKGDGREGPVPSFKEHDQKLYILLMVKFQ